MGAENVALLALLVPVLGLAGFVSGVVGFAFSGIGSVIFWVMPPIQAVSLLLALSIANQMLSVSFL